MSITSQVRQPNVYRVTHATLDQAGLHLESEAAIHLPDGSVTTLSVPAKRSELRVIERFVRGCTLHH